MRDKLVVSGMLVLVSVGCAGTVAPETGDTIPIPSQDAELMTTHPRVPEPDPEIEIVLDEPEPEPEVDEPAVPPPLEACLPGNAGPTLALASDDLRLCFNRAGDLLQPADECLWINATGKVRVDVPPPMVATSDVTLTVSADAATAEVCRAGTPCVAIAPTLAAGQTIQQAALDEGGDRVALLLQAGDEGAGTVAIHDAHDGHAVARGTRAWRKGGKVSYEIGFVGSAILWIEYPGALEPGNAQLWKTKRTELKLRKPIPHQVSAWGSVGGDRYVFTGDGTRAEVWDIHRARRVADVDLKRLVVGATEQAAWRELDRSSDLATAPGGFALLVQTPVAARIAFVDTTHHHPRQTIVSVPLCAD